MLIISLPARLQRNNTYYSILFGQKQDLLCEANRVIDVCVIKRKEQKYAIQLQLKR